MEFLSGVIGSFQSLAAQASPSGKCPGCNGARHTAQLPTVAVLEYAPSKRRVPLCHTSIQGVCTLHHAELFTDLDTRATSPG